MQWTTSSAGTNCNGFSRIASVLWVAKLDFVTQLKVIEDVSQSTADILKLEKG